MRFKSANIGSTEQSQQLQQLPQAPGVYIFIDTQGRPIYIGKAVNIKRRVTQHFQSNHPTPRHRQMIHSIHEIEVITTQTETEALLLENNLIKSQMPMFNIKLKDEKSYPYIHLSLDEAFPRLSVCWKKKFKKGELFGPFVSKKTTYQLVDFLHKMFGIRECHNTQFKHRTRPCLKYEIGRCSAPCVQKITEQAYRKRIEAIRRLLQGNSSDLKQFCTEKMMYHSQHQAYEKAAFYRDRLADIQSLFETQSVCQSSGHYDVYGIMQDAQNYYITRVWVRSGDVIDYQNITLNNPITDSLGHCLTQIMQHDLLDTLQLQYHPPDEILVSHTHDDQSTLSTLIKAQLGRACPIKTYQRGPQKQFIELALHHAQLSARSQQKRGSAALLTDSTLKSELSLTQAPQSIECFDISHFQGSATIGACVVFNAQGPVKRAYSVYPIQKAKQSDDYAALAEVVQLRYSSEHSEQPKPLPELILIDGGPAQLNAVLEALQHMNLEETQLFAISKGPSRKAGLEKLHFKSGALLQLPHHSAAAHFLQHIRDEAHACAIRHHRKKQKKLSLSSLLEMIPGIGPQKRDALLKHFLTLKTIQSADIHTLSAVPGISKHLASNIHDFFKTDRGF